MDDAGIFCSFRESQSLAIFFRVAAGNRDYVNDIPGIIVAALMDYLKTLFFQ